MASGRDQAGQIQIADERRQRLIKQQTPSPPTERPTKKTPQESTKTLRWLKRLFP